MVFGDVATSVPEAFERLTRGNPEAVALAQVSFGDRGTELTPYTRKQVLDGARMLGTWLAELGVQPRDRVLVSIAEPYEFLQAMLGIQCIGAIPVPVPEFHAQVQAYVERISAVARDARPRATLLGDARAEAAIPAELRASLSIVRWASEQPRVVESSRFRTTRDPDEVAFLQYTSGSTSSPKGVVVLHRNLMANLIGIAEGAELGAGDSIFSWLPLFHDMGLVAGLLLGVWLGIPTYVAKPSAFARRPANWLRAIHDLRATFSAGPNFAYDVLARRIGVRFTEDLDLSSWRLAFNGAELVDRGTVSSFIQRWGRHGFAPESMRPAYGLAEATLAVAFSRGGVPEFDCVRRDELSAGRAVPTQPSDPRATYCAAVGVPIANHDIRIVDPETRDSLGERHVGEIVVSGPAVTPGYYTTLEDGAAPRSELSTGDLGYFWEGSLFVVDRMKDIIVVAGRKYVPTEIERMVGAVDGVRNGAVIAFSARGGRGTEELFIAAGLEARGHRIKDAIEASIQRVLGVKEYPTPAGVFLVRPGALPKTSSGKLRRAACRSLLEAGFFGNGHGGPTR